MEQFEYETTFPTLGYILTIYKNDSSYFVSLHWETTHHDDNLAAVVMIDLYWDICFAGCCVFSDQTYTDQP